MATNTNVVAAMGSHVVVVTDSEWLKATTSDRVALTVSEVCTLRNSDVEVVLNSDQAAETITDRTIAIDSAAVYSDVVDNRQQRKRLGESYEMDREETPARAHWRRDSVHNIRYG